MSQASKNQRARFRVGNPHKHYLLQQLIESPGTAAGDCLTLAAVQGMWTKV